MIRFIHAADVHLDSPLRGLDQYEGAPADAIRGATRKAFSNLVQLALSRTEPIDFVVLAGDLYDGDWPDYNTGLFFVNRVRELEKANIPVVLLKGNHDAESRITARLTLPSNVHLLPTDQPGTVTLDKIRVAVHGQGYARQAETRNLAAEYPRPTAGCFNIGMLHTALDGRDGHAPYAPCTLAELLARGYDYWALGHSHRRESVNGSDRIRVEFPGNLQGRHVRETGPKGCLLVTVDAAGQAKPDFRPLDVFRWEVASVDVTGAESTAEALDTIANALTDLRDSADGRTLAVRVMLSCSEDLSREIGGNMERFRFEVAGLAGADIWVEKIKLRPNCHSRSAEPILAEDAFSELRAVLAELRSESDTVQSVFADGDCGKLKKQLPPELRDVILSNLEDVFSQAEAILTAEAPEGDA